MSHDHHHHDHHHSSESNIKVAFFINLIFTILEIIGGIYSNSVAILSDAVHDLGDSLALGTSWFLQRKSKEKPNYRYSFGYARFSLLGALINSIVLIVGAIFVVQEAIKRIIHPEESDANGMLFFAILGIVVNGYAAWKLSKGKTLNERVVSWHLIEDVLGWVAVLIVAIVLQFKTITYLDPLLSLMITIYILWGVFSRLKETMHLFLQGVPNDLDLEKINHRITAIEGVHSVHRTQIWSLDGEQHVFSTHIKVSEEISPEDFSPIKTKVKEELHQFNFKFLTIEIERQSELCEFE